MYIKIIFAKMFCVEIIFLISTLNTSPQLDSILYRPPFHSPSLINAATIQYNLGIKCNGMLPMAD